MPPIANTSTPPSSSPNTQNAILSAQLFSPSGQSLATHLSLVTTTGPSLLFIGDEVIASSRSLLSHFSISHIVNVSKTFETTFSDLGIQYLRFPIPDSPHSRLGPYFDEVAEFVRDAAKSGDGSRTLIHCSEGISRSATLVLSTLMINHHLRLAQAFDTLKRARSVVEPNVGFFRELRALEMRLFGDVTSLNRLSFRDDPTPPSDAPVDMLLEEVAVLISKAAVGATTTPTTDRPKLSHPVDLFGRLDAKERTEFLTQAILFKTFDIYASLELHAVRARAELASFLMAVIMGGTIQRQVLRQELERLFEGEDWGELLVDVPLGNRFKTELMGCLGF